MVLWRSGELYFRMHRKTLWWDRLCSKLLSLASCASACGHPGKMPQKCLSLLIRVMIQWLCQRTQESIVSESFFCPAPWTNLWHPEATSTCFQPAGQWSMSWRVRRKQDQACCTRVSQAGPDSTVQWVVGSYMKSTLHPYPGELHLPESTPLCKPLPCWLSAKSSLCLAQWDTNKCDVGIAWIHTCLHWDSCTSLWRRPGSPCRARNKCPPAQPTLVRHMNEAISHRANHPPADLPWPQMPGAFLPKTDEVLRVSSSTPQRPGSWTYFAPQR